MKREDQVKNVLEVGSTIRTDVPVTLKAVRQKMKPVTIGRETVDVSQTFLRIQLPTGHYIDCRVEGHMGEEALTEALTKDPYFKPFFDALNPKKLS